MNTDLHQIFTDQEIHDFDSQEMIMFFELSKARFIEIFGISSDILPNKINCSLTIEFRKKSTFMVIEVYDDKKIHLLIKLNVENLPEKVETLYQMFKRM